MLCHWLTRVTSRRSRKKKDSSPLPAQSLKSTGRTTSMNACLYLHSHGRACSDLESARIVIRLSTNRP